MADSDNHSEGNGNDDDDDMLHEMDEEIADTSEGSHDVVKMQTEHIKQLRECMFKYSLKLREKYLLPASTHADIVADCKSLVNSVLTCHNDVISCHLENKGYDIHSDNDLVRNILDTGKYDRLWSGCETSYKLQQNCSQLLGMIKPVQHTVSGYKNYYIPLTDILTMLVKKDDIMPMVLQSPLLHDESHLTGFTSGDAFLSMKLLMNDCHWLLIHLYNDEFEVVNPIGAKRGKHKLNATYFTLGNLPAKFRSSLQHIHLVNVVKHKAVNESGYSAVFAPLVDELQKLYSEGFTVTLANSHTEKFRAVLCTVSGDNLSSHALAGFRAVFNSGHVCRMCMIAHDELANCDSNVTLRNAANHAYHLQAVKENCENAAIYGVNGPSVFAALEYFDVTQGFPPDVMHDCMEGVIPVITGAIVKLMVMEKITTVTVFNKRLAAFIFKGAESKTKPEPLRNDCHIVGSASQKLCLFQFLPFLADLEQCPTAVRLYTLAREVMSYALSRCISRNDLDYFEQKIISLRECIRDDFPQISITPKFHYLVHYPAMNDGPIWSSAGCLVHEV